MRAASVPSFLLFLIASSAIAQIGPEIAVAPARLAATPVRLPRIASNGSGFLAVWSDDRAGGGRIRGARLDADANVLDPTGFPIAISEAAAVASAGSDYLVAFETSNQIDVVIVGSDGSVSPPKTIATAPPADTLDIATNGSTYLVTFGSGAVLVDRSGTVVHAPYAFGTLHAAVASNGTDYLVVASAAQVETIFISSAGDASAPQVYANQPSASGVAIASDGDAYMIVATSYAVLLESVDHRGAIVAMSQPSSQAATVPRIVWNGIEYVAGWSQFETLRLARANADATPLDMGTYVGIGDSLDLVRNGKDLLMLRGGLRSVTKITEVDLASGKIADGTPLTLTAATQHEPFLATMGDLALLVWIESSPLGVQMIRGVALDRTGTPQGSPFDIATSSHAMHASVAFDGAFPMIAWSDGTALYAQQWSAPATPHLLAGDAGASTIAAGGTTDVFVYESASGIAAQLMFYVDGPPQFAPLHMPPPAGANRHPAAAFDGHGYAIAWAHDDDIVLVGARPTPPTIDVDASPRTIASRAHPIDDLALASNGGDVYAVWSEQSLVYGMPTTSTPRLLSPNETTTSPRIAPFGSEYVAGWLALTSHGVRPEIRFTAGGDVIAFPEVPATGGVSGALTTIGSTVLFVYPRLTDDAQQIFVRTYAPPQKRHAARK